MNRRAEHKAMHYLSVCSGIEAATVAWAPLGWQAVAFAEIDRFPAAVLAHHYPQVPNLGDLTAIKGDDYRGLVDLFVGGTPCQSFSSVGLRRGLADPRGQLTLKFFQLVDRIRPRWVVWENVPGVLPDGGGRTFGAVLGALGQCGYGFAYRILDAQYFGVPQRRRRVFVVGHLGDWRPAAAVLLERHSLSGDSPPRRSQGGAVAGTFTSRANSGGWGHDVVTRALLSDGQKNDLDSETFIALPYAIQVRACSENIESGPQGKGFQRNIAYTVDARSRAQTVVPPPLTHKPYADNTSRENGLVVAFHGSQDPDVSGDITHPAGRNNGLETCVMAHAAVRRLTPKEAERLQGLEDNYTLIPWRGKSAADCPDGPRYKAIGNSMAVPVMRWIGERIQMVDGMLADTGPEERE